MRKFKILMIATFLIAATVAAYWTKFYFDMQPMLLHNVEDGSIDWPYVLLVFTFPFVATFCVGMLLGSLPLLMRKLFRWIKRRLAASRPMENGTNPEN